MNPQVDYHDTRLVADRRRTVVWQSLWRYYFRYLINPSDCVVDLGCGYGDFINSVHARRRIAVDTWECIPEIVDDGVETVVSRADELGALPDGGVDFVLASNLFEHLSFDILGRVLTELRSKLTPQGQLVLLQPNYRYAYREYFDDYTHRTVFTHVSLCDFLRSEGWEPFDVRPRFLPLTVKSRLPVFPWLIRGYLTSPIKILGKQMLVRARPA